MTSKASTLTATNSAGYWTLPGLTVDVVIFSLASDGRLLVLLTRRQDPPYRGRWALPGGFLGETESFELTAARKLKAKTGMDAPQLELVGAYSDLRRDPRGRIPSLLYMAMLPGTPLALADGEWPSAWHEVDDLPALAFDHGQMIADARGKARGKLWPSLLAPSFTLKQAQVAYEAVTGETYDTPNFRRDLLKSGLIDATGDTIAVTGGPRAKTYSWVQVDATAWAPGSR